MATATKVLTSDGLLYYTQLLRVKLADKLEDADLTPLENSIPSTITITQSSSNVTFALTSTNGTGTATTLPAVDSTNAGLMTPTMLSKLNGIAAGAEVNVQSNWNETNSSSDAYIQNKPTLATVATSGSYNDLSNKPSIPDDTGLVHIAGTETITGNKAFTGSTSIDNGTVLGQLLIDNDNGLGEIVLEDETEAGWLQIKRKTSNSTETLQSALNAKQNVIDSSHKLSADLISDGTTNKAYTATEQTKLSGIDSGAQVNTIENIKIEGESSNVSISSKLATIPLATTSTSGAMSDTDKTKLNGIATGAQANVIESVKIDGTALSISSKAVNIPLASTSADGAMSLEDKTKLDGVATGAQVNVIESIKLQGASSDLSISSKKVTIPVDTSATSGSGNPISSGAMYTALGAKAPLASPALTGTPTAPTATAGTNTTQIATTAFVQAAISAAVSGSFKFVNELPVTGEEGYIYLVPHTHSASSTNTNPDVKDEYIWNTSANPAQWELIGNTDLDLSNYWNKTELVALTTSEITNIWNTGMTDSNS